jgi:hypothetical protein
MILEVKYPEPWIHQKPQKLKGRAELMRACVSPTGDIRGRTKAEAHVQRKFREGGEGKKHGMKTELEGRWVGIYKGTLERK